MSYSTSHPRAPLLHTPSLLDWQARWKAQGAAGAGGPPPGLAAWLRAANRYVSPTPP
jgi:hypothetical protein